jgi:dienelactone hydrolase
MMQLSYEVKGRTYTGHLALPPARDPAPGVLVLHGGGGLGRHAKERAAMLAEQGFVAFAADLFGHPVKGLEHALSLTHALTEDWVELRSRCIGALDVLRRRPDVDSARMAAIGFCFGGQAALELGRAGAPLRAIVGFHSRLETRRAEDTASIRASVLVCLGDQDRFVSGDEREHFLENMSVSRVDCQMLLFAGVQHGFTDPYAEASGVPGLKYDARADRRAWMAMMALLAEAFAA